jgi:hypothetical protein
VQRLLRRVLDDVRLTRRSFESAWPLWIGLLVGGTAVCVLMGAMGAATNADPGYAFTEFREEGFHSGIMTAVSAFLLGAGATALFAVAAIFRRRPDTRELFMPWAVAATGLLILGADDLLMLHEVLGYKVMTMGWPRPLGLPYDSLAFVAYGVGTVLVLGRILESLRRYWRALFPLLLALALFVVAEAIDVFVPLDSLTHAQQAIAGPADRVAKTLGTLMMFAFSQTLLVAVATDSLPSEGRGAPHG